MYDFRWEYASYALISIAWLMVWLPVVVFLFRAWGARRDLLFDYFDDEALRLYYAQFFPAEDLAKLDAVQLKANFKRRFYALYSRRYYWVPILLFATLAGMGLWALAVFVPRTLTLPTHNACVLWVPVSPFPWAYCWLFTPQLSPFAPQHFT